MRNTVPRVTYAYRLQVLSLIQLLTGINQLRQRVIIHSR